MYRYAGLKGSKPPTNLHLGDESSDLTFIFSMFLLSKQSLGGNVYTQCVDEGAQQSRVSLGVLLGLCQQLTLQNLSRTG